MLEVSELTKRYGKVNVVESLSFVARDGQVTGFVGPNGAGKSTTMRSMLGLDTPTSGHALIDGRPITSYIQPSTVVGALLDAGWVNGGRSARNHLLCMTKMAGLPSRRVDEVLDIVGLDDAAKKYIGKFSLGMRQRLGVAGALLGSPRNLIFDEPLNGLDPEGVHWMRSLMRQHAENGGCVLVSSHLLSELAMTADSLVVIGRGHLIGSYKTSEFVARMTIPEVTVRVDDPAALTAELRFRGWDVKADPGTGALSVTGPNISTDAVSLAARDRGLAIFELSQVKASLEDAFLRATHEAVEYRTDNEMEEMTVIR